MFSCDKAWSCPPCGDWVLNNGRRSLSQNGSINSLKMVSSAKRAQFINRLHPAFSVLLIVFFTMLLFVELAGFECISGALDFGVGRSWLSRR